MADRTHIYYKQRIQAVADHVQRNLANPLPLAELACVAGFSPFHFHRVFASVTGETIGAFVRRLRLEQAASLLEFTPKTVTELAVEARYDSLEAFSRAFKTHFGQSPTAYRQGAAAKRRTRLAEQEAALTAALPRPAPAALPMDVRIVRRPAVRVAFVRAFGPYEQCCKRAWDELCAWAGPAGLLGPKATLLGVNYDDPSVTPEDKIRYDACLALPADTMPPDHIGVMTIEGGEFAVGLHTGPHERLEQAYVFLYGTWLPASGRLPALKPPFEMYLNTPETTAPADLLTQLNVALEPETPQHTEYQPCPT